MRGSVLPSRLAALLGFLIALPVWAQTPPTTMRMGPDSSARMSMGMRTPDPLGVTMERMGSGTTWVPDAAPIPAYNGNAGSWDLTGHGFVFGQYDHQSGTRGSNQFGSLDWIMLMATHTLAGGRFQARTMLSLDAVGVGARGYPLLLQSGETYRGQPLHDLQHPHDMLMELGALYERPITSSAGVLLYVAPSGEPALGPVAFMHRPSAMDIPSAPIGHHWQDATHITFGVVTAGLFGNRWRLEASAFNGREPDEHRFNLEPIRLDSYSGRVTVQPDSHWSVEAGYGFVHSPEPLEPNRSQHRITASVLHGKTLGSSGQWASSLIYGENIDMPSGRRARSGLAETEAVLDQRNTLFARAEVVEKTAEDLVLDGTPSGFAADRSFTVGALSLGGVREVGRAFGSTLGVGAMGTMNLVPNALLPAYGSRTPLGAMLFVRLRASGSRKFADPMAGMKMN